MANIMFLKPLKKVLINPILYDSKQNELKIIIGLIIKLIIDTKL